MRQDPCVATAASLEGLEAGAAVSWPRAVFLGMGICSGDRISLALPLDILGMLLPAERIRRAVGAREIIVLVADVHAPLGRDGQRRWQAQVRRLMSTLLRIRSRLGLARLSLSTASVLRASTTRSRLGAMLRARAPDPGLRYLREEAADIETTRQLAGPLLKVGWTLGPGARRDEAGFDRAYRKWFDATLPLVYCKAGRTLDDRRTRAAPFIALDPDRRVCLSPGERSADKLAAAAGRARRDTVNGVRRHLRAITRDYCQVVEPLDGPLEARVDMVVRRITC